MCCRLPCFLVLVCTYYGPLQCFSIQFRKLKEIWASRSVFSDYVIFCDYDKTYLQHDMVYETLRIYLESLKKYFRQSLGFMWKSALRKKFIFCFRGGFLIVLTKFFSGVEPGTRKGHFSDISWFPNILSLTSCSHLWGNL